jgi:hypothetical protein
LEFEGEVETPAADASMEAITSAVFGAQVGEFAALLSLNCNTMPLVHQ